MAEYLALVKYRGDSAEDLLYLHYTVGGVVVDTDIRTTEWVPSAEHNDELVSETIRLSIRAGNGADLVTAVKELSQKIQEFKWSLEQTDKHYVWLLNLSEFEQPFPDTRRAMVLDISGRPDSPWHSRTSINNNYLTYTITLLRQTYWETTAISLLNALTLNCDGGSGVIPYRVDGDTSARISEVQIYPSGGTANGLNQVWFGFRSNRLGDQGAFQSTWNCGDGVQESADTALTPGGSAVCNFTTAATESDRVTVRISDATSDANEHRGEYQVLLRASVDAGTICYVRMKHGMYGGTGTGYAPQLASHQLVKIDAAEAYTTNSYLFNMGTITIPAGKDPNFVISNFALRLAARRTSVAGTLTMDRLILIPRSEGFLHISNANILTASERVELAIQSTGEIEGYQFESGIPAYSITPNPYRFAVPPGDVKIVLAAQRATSHNASDSVNLFMRFHRRYYLLAWT
ncbi:MAG: hypothetical protein ACYS30_24730 [Planctomycetota bacterium]|jgi:hypothetical protein